MRSIRTCANRSNVSGSGLSPTDQNVTSLRYTADVFKTAQTTTLHRDPTMLFVPSVWQCPRSRRPHISNPWTHSRAVNHKATLSSSDNFSSLIVLSVFVVRPPFKFSSIAPAALIQSFIPSSFYTTDNARHFGRCRV